MSLHSHNLASNQSGHLVLLDRHRNIRTQEFLYEQRIRGHDSSSDNQLVYLFDVQVGMKIEIKVHSNALSRQSGFEFGRHVHAVSDDHVHAYVVLVNAESSFTLQSMTVNQRS